MEKNIIEFLLKAKKATYAGKGEENSPSRPKSHDLEYEHGELKYIDTYLGGYKFAGEEALWKCNNPFWAMNYAGRVLSDDFEGVFLKEALSNVPEEIPFRGPREFIRDDFVYRCVITGDFDWFNGTEEIFKCGIKVYECVFHGGSIN